MEDYYKCEKAEKGPHIPRVMFADEEISLKIPREKKRKWEVTPLVRPTVSFNNGICMHYCACLYLNIPV